MFKISSKKLITIMAVVFALVILILILLDIKVDNSNNKKEDNKKNDYNQFEYTNIEEDEVLAKYIQNYVCSFYLSDAYKITSDEYKSLCNNNILEFENIFKNKFYNCNLQKIEYEVIQEDNKKVYICDVTLYNELEKTTKTETIIVTEYSPENYEVALDGLISVTEENKLLEENDVSIIVNKVRKFTNKIQVDATITNSSENDVIINKANTHLNYKTDYIITKKDLINSSETTIVSGTSQDLILEFEKCSDNNFNIVIKEIVF